MERGTRITKAQLELLYLKRGKSLQEIARILGCSSHKISYWLGSHKIKTRSISEAVYLKNNPHGDPFKFVPPKNMQDAELFGMGLGLYWGEGTKAERASVKLGNTDPKLIKKFIKFLVRFFSVKRVDMRFGLQIFSDTSAQDALDFWTKSLKISNQQFYKPTVTRSGSIGTYRKKSQYGVLTVYYHNTKMRDLLVGMLPM